MNPVLLEGVRYFTRETGILSGLSAACGTRERTETAMDGEVTGRSLFDLASVTKLFTGLCLMKMKEDGLLDPGRPVSYYDSRFRKLGEKTVWDLMTFAGTIRTPVRLDACPDRESALAALFAAEGAEQTDRRVYSDIPAMILKYVAEAVGGMPLAECVRKTVLEPAGMKETWARVPEERRGDCQSYDREHRMEQGRYILRTGLRPGVPHDPKAAVIQGDTGDLCGHAGLFSTLEDMERLARALLAGRLLKPEGLAQMAVNRTGRMLPDGSYTQYLGYCCYRRHPDQYYSEIPAHMSDAAFGIGGFTGNHFSVDPGTGWYTVMLGNRVRDRLTVLLPPEGRRREDYGLRADGTGEIRWRDGTVHPSSVNYVHQKDEHLHAVIARMLTREEGE